MTEKMITLLQEVEPFRAAASYVKDIDIVYSYIEYYDRAESSHCASVYLQKYQPTLSAMGKISGGVRLVYDNNIYNNKTDDDIIDDLYFIIWGIICEARVIIGFERTVQDFVIKHFYDK